MGRTKISALVGAALFFLPAAGALAADIPNIPSPPAQFAGGWYLRGDIGMAAQGFKGLDHPDFATAVNFLFLDKGHFDAVPTFGLGLGYQASDHIRFDLTGEYRGKSDFSALDQFTNPASTPPDATQTNHYTGKKSELLFLVNGYYDFSAWRGITPYVGAGVGMSYNTISDFLDDNVLQPAQGWAPTGHQWSFAWALHAGASMKVTDNLSLDLGYSFVSLGDAQTGLFQNSDPSVPCNGGTCHPMKFEGIYSHDFKVGLRWAFDAPQQASYYPPVVKY
jgi:opacity protein-like surface antigen